MSADNVLSAELLGGAIGEARARVHVIFANATTPAAPVDDTAFAVASWTLVPDPIATIPRYTPTVTAVVADADGFGAVLTADQELTPGVVYSAVATGVTGIAENGIDNVAAFASLPITSAPADREFTLQDWVSPVNEAEDDSEDEANFIAALQEAVDLQWDYVDRWIETFDCDLAPERFLDLLLADLGNPFTFPDALSVTEKRKLCRLLVKIYKLKGSIPGMQAAILFFLGLTSEFIAYDGLGSSYGQVGSIGDVEYGQASGNSPIQAFYGTGEAFQFVVKLGTLTPEAGSPATALQVDRALRIVRIMKPVGFELKDILAGFIQSGPRPSKRNSIQDNGAGSVDLIMEIIPNADAYIFFESTQPGVQQFNTQAELAAATGGGVAKVAAHSPGGTRYFNGVGKNVGDNTRGLLFNEVTNALTKPTLTATAGTRKITLAWGAVTGATSYRLYRSVATFASPTLADNADAPIEISGDLTSYEDRLESGTLRYYRITPVVGHNSPSLPTYAFDAEGFFSAVHSATAL